MSVETHLTVDSDGNVVITDYTPMPKYPDYCYIELLDPSGNIIDSRDVFLETRSGTQGF